VKRFLTSVFRLSTGGGQPVGSTRLFPYELKRSLIMWPNKALSQEFKTGNGSVLGGIHVPARPLAASRYGA
jgi:hypothetical protein